MTSEAWYQRLLAEKIGLERLLLIGFVLVSGFMLWETTNFSISSAGRFPRLTASVVLVGSLLLLFQKYLPGPVQKFVAEETEVFTADEEFAEQQEEAAKRTEQEDKKEEDSTGSSVGRPINDSFFTGLSAFGYGLLGYTIGIFLATPLFVIVYTRWFRVKLHITVILVIVAILIAYGFFEILNVPLDRGEIYFTDGVL